MRKITSILLLVGLFAAGGCNTPVTLSGEYATPKETITGGLATGTNSVTLSGAFATTNQTVGGAVTVEK